MDPYSSAGWEAVDMGAFADPETVLYRWQMPVELEANGVYVEAPARGGGTELFTGTSFACPHVAGVVARGKPSVVAVRVDSATGPLSGSGVVLGRAVITF